VGAINLVNLGYRRQLSTDLSVVAILSDAFDGQTFRRYVHGAGFDSQYARQQLGRIAYVGFVHVIGAPKKQKAPSFDYDQ